MKHRLYKLESKFTILGMGWLDWAIVLGAFIFSTQVLGAFATPRLKFFLCLLVTALVYWAWFLIKDKVPDKFPEHFVVWLGEPEVYRCVPDTQNVPLVVDPEQVRPRAPEGALWKRGGKPGKHRIAETFAEEVRTRGVAYER